MRIINLGKTGLRISRIGLGTAALGRPGYINLGHGNDLAGQTEVETMEIHAHRMFDMAYSLGIRYFDTARSYGKGEAFLAHWLHKKGHDDAVTGSKWGYIYTADWQTKAEKHEVKEHSLENLIRQYEESIALLKSRLAIYQIHSATFDTGVLENDAVLEKLWELKASGLRIGLSLSGTEQAGVLQKALTIRNSEKLLFDTVQATFNVLEQSAGGILEEASIKGVGVIIKEGVANGRLTARGSMEEDNEARFLMEEIARKHKTGIDAIALAFILNHSWVHTALSGATTPEQLKANCEAERIQLDKNDMERLGSCSQSPSAYWKIRSRLRWN